jgi:hypothetical protein
MTVETGENRRLLPKYRSWMGQTCRHPTRCGHGELKDTQTVIWGVNDARAYCGTIDLRLFPSNCRERRKRQYTPYASISVPIAAWHGLARTTRQGFIAGKNATDLTQTPPQPLAGFMTLLRCRFGYL